MSIRYLLKPDLEKLPLAQRRLWPELSTVPAGLLEEGIDLSRALAAARAVFGSRFNPLLSLKALSYFADGDLASLPAAVRSRLLTAVQAVDLSRIPEIAPLPGGLLP